MFTIEEIFKKRKEKKSLTVKKTKFDNGSITWIKGPNGCGKTMLLDIIAGVNYPNKSSYLVDEKSYKKIHKVLSIFYMHNQDEYLTNFREEDIVNLKLREKENRLFQAEDFGLNSNLSSTTSSIGSRKKIMFLSIPLDFQVYLFDEPCIGLDEQGTKTFIEGLKKLKKLGCVIILKTHSDAFKTIITNQLVFKNGVFSEVKK